MKIKISENMWQDLKANLLARNDVETAGIMLGEPIHTSCGLTIVIRRALVIPDEAYLIRRPDQLSIDPIALNRLTKLARDKGWSIFTIHTHPQGDDPWFSLADDMGDSRLMPSLHCQISGVPHGSLVLVSNGKVIARAFDETGGNKAIPFHVIGKTLSIFGNGNTQIQKWFSRQELALGAAGNLKLQNIRVGIVGLGGVGSLVSMQLAHLGVGELVLIDGDVIETSNISRIVCAERESVGHIFKVDVAANYAKALGLSKSIERYVEYLTVAHEALVASCDVILCCVDTHSPRALLNRLSYKYHVPVIDMGSVFRIDECGGIISDAGRVVIVGPGRACLACWGHLDADAIRNESLSSEEREKEVQEGYIQGATVEQPSVITFNTQIAGAAVTELLRMVTSFAGSDTPPDRLSFSFKEGTIRRNSLAGNTQCAICNRSPLS
jgi:molybdopterin-synthase adenylyltransferase